PMNTPTAVRIEITRPTTMAMIALRKSDWGLGRPSQIIFSSPTSSAMDRRRRPGTLSFFEREQRKPDGTRGLRAAGSGRGAVFPLPGLPRDHDCFGAGRHADNLPAPGALDLLACQLIRGLEIGGAGFTANGNAHGTSPECQSWSATRSMRDSIS